MSVISSRKSLSSSILKSTSGRSDSIKKTKFLRFEVNLVDVKSILKEVAENPNAKSYQDLIYRLTEPDLKSEDLRKIISEAIESVQLINKDHILLVQSILKIRWITREVDIIELYHKFLLGLMTSSNDFLVLCLSKIIACFVPDDDEFDLWINGNASEEFDSKLKLVHKLLKNAFDVMPMLPLPLRKQIRLEFPYYKQPNFKIVAYIDNLFRILDYAPNMTHDVLDLVLENLLQIDVNVSREQIEEAEEEETEEPANDDDETMKLPVAETLDNCMEKVLNFFHTKLKDNSDITKTEQQTIIQAVFTYFDEHIIKTHTKHLHFILFYIASFRRTFMNDFLTYLWAKIIDRNQSSTIRQTAIGYLSSFLSRANFMSQDVFKTYLKKLSNWAHDYIKACDYQNNRNPKAHVVFYSVCQAIFYIIAFRSRELMRCLELNLKFLRDLNLWPIVKHPLNPLNYCLPAIATIFDNITTKYQILCCHTILVSNASKSLTTVYANEQHRAEDILDTVFPFDPYLLKKSSKRIHPFYTEYEPDHGFTESASNSPRGSQKRIRYESASGELEDFIIRDSKAPKLH